MIALGCGCLIDLLVGDPHGIWHPVVWAGSFISFLEKKLLGNGEDKSRETKRRRGILLCALVTGVSIILTGLVISLSYLINRYVGVAAEVVLTAYILAARSLYNESMKVYFDIEKKDIESARYNLSMIVGRDTKDLEEASVIRAAVETVAENTSDGVIAPLLYTAIGGPVLGMAYKAVNTMDSMVGYKNERYEDFGRAAAKLDDVVNFLPTRISAVLMVLSAAFCGIFTKKISGKESLRIWRRDRRNHTSPNSAQTESACAGALRVRLGGDSYYKGILVKKPFIGDDLRQIENEDIKRANLLMFLSEGIMMVSVFGLFFTWIRI